MSISHVRVIAGVPMVLRHKGCDGKLTPFPFPQINHVWKGPPLGLLKEVLVGGGDIPNM